MSLAAAAVLVFGLWWLWPRSGSVPEATTTTTPAPAVADQPSLAAPAVGAPQAASAPSLGAAAVSPAAPMPAPEAAAEPVIAQREVPPPATWNGGPGQGGRTGSPIDQFVYQSQQGGQGGPVPAAAGVPVQLVAPAPRPPGGPPAPAGQPVMSDPPLVEAQGRLLPSDPVNLPALRLTHASGILRATLANPGSTAVMVFPGSLTVSALDPQGRVLWRGQAQQVLIPASGSASWRWRPPALDGVTWCAAWNGQGATAP
jgi:hypothetical protein